MKLSDLRFEYPEDLVATAPQRPSRVLWVEQVADSISAQSQIGGQIPDQIREIGLSDLLSKIPKGDILVVNNTRVLKRRVFASLDAGVGVGSELEILFLAAKSPRQWEVLFPAKKYPVGAVIPLPEGRKMTLLQKGRPQLVELDAEVSEDYFARVAELPLPPYIQKARGERHTQAADASWYQTAWAKKDGSFAAPTASLHFSEADMAALRARGVRVLEVTLHVGLGTFLPVAVEDLDQHEMHEEYFEVPEDCWQEILQSKAKGSKVWALGTTAVRAMESAARGKTSGFTNILLQEGAEFKVVDRLLTNFHQPESTLLALVCGFTNKELVKSAYKFAMDQRFRLFSYGDLSAWIKL